MDKTVVYRGTPAVLEIACFERDGETPIPVAGLNLHWVCSRNASWPPFLHLTGAAITPHAEQANVAVVELAIQHTLALPPGALYHELYHVVAGEPKRVLFEAHRREDKLPVQAAQAARHEVA